MEIKENFSLKSLNTFSINVDSKFYAEVASVEEIKKAKQFIDAKNIPFLILGGGSNLLLTKDFDGMVMKVAIKGIEVLNEDEDHIYIKASGGEDWDEFVSYCVEHSYSGLENLSLIPGNVGTSPIQNIGAYGVEMKDHFESLEFFDFEIKEVKVFSREDCRFGYRESVFKKELKKKGIITSVTFRLNKKPEFKTSYGVIQEELKEMGIIDLSIKAIRKAVIKIRRSKLPDPKEIGNSGSFFKNPVVDAKKHIQLKNEFENLVSFAQPDGTYKLAAGWMIDQCGWKGYREGDVGVHAKQALVLVNYGSASGQEIINLSEKIQDSIFEKFGVHLEPEVNVI